MDAPLPRWKRALRALVGSRPSFLLFVVSPTLLALVLDFTLRARALLVYPPFEWLNYTGSTLASAGFWGLPLWIGASLFRRDTRLSRAGLIALFGLFVLPLAIFCYGGQALYFKAVGAYMARDTVRVGMALRGTLTDWLTDWGGRWVYVALGAVAIPVTLGFAWCAKKASAPLSGTWPVLPLLGFGIASVCFWTDFVESRSLQAAPPDTCFLHGVFHAVRDGVTGKGWVRHGFALRKPLPLPEIPKAPHRPNILVVLTESVRADAVCSEAPPACKEPFVDPVMPDRTPLGRLITQSPGTFSACMMLWTGLPPNVDLETAHEAPVLWEVARAAGYKTAYFTSQNLRYDDFGAFVERAGIDEKVSALELGDTKNAQMGAPDEYATERLAAWIEKLPPDAPYFAFLHFSNTHSPYRIDPGLLPFTPQSDKATGDVGPFHNRYRDSVALQERTLGAFLQRVRALPSWDDTVVLYLSDHGEAFREHGRLYHINNLFDEEVRVPGWLASGAHALTQDQKTALRLFSGRRTDTQDVNATLLDLMGALDARKDFPFAKLLTGRSLVRPPHAPMQALMATATAVWAPDDPKVGAMTEDRLVVRSAASPWSCYDLPHDPSEDKPLPPEVCGGLRDVAQRAFPNVGQ
jgi:Sulfatase